MIDAKKAALFQRVGYKPHPKQELYHQSNARFRIPVCGRRFGKSKMAGVDIEPKLFSPKKRFWAVGPTYDLGEKEFRVVWDDLIVGQKLGLDKRIKKAYNRRSGEMYIEFPWQTRFEVRSADHPEGLVGESLDGVIMSEAAKHKQEVWERYIRPALADNRGFADFPTTPEGFNWLYNLWGFGQNPDVAAYESWQFPSWDNPYVYPGGRQDPEILLLEQTTVPEWFMQEIGADFASFVGKIYSEFSEIVHVKPHTFNPNWPNYIAFDWGFVQPLAAVEFQVDPWDNVYVWREHYKAYWRLEQHLQAMKDREQPEGYRIDCCFGDAADPEAAAFVSTHFAPCLTDPLAKSNWRQGIDLVKMFLKEYQIGEADEFGTPLSAPKLTMSRNCPNLIREFNNYRAQDNTNSSTNESGARSAAQKQDDHALDALRYGLMHIFELGARHHLNEVMDMPSLLVASGPETGYFVSDRMVF
jgi:hypothetical protein